MQYDMVWTHNKQGKILCTVDGCDSNGYKSVGSLRHHWRKKHIRLGTLTFVEPPEESSDESVDEGSLDVLEASDTERGDKQEVDEESEEMSFEADVEQDEEMPEEVELLQGVIISDAANDSDNGDFERVEEPTPLAKISDPNANPVKRLDVMNLKATDFAAVGSKMVTLLSWT